MKINTPGKCAVDWCQEPLLWKGLCRVHYSRRQTHRDMNTPFRINHGLTDTPEHEAWVNMWQRTGNPNHRDYRHYGGRGIKVEEKSWKRFLPFLADMGKRPVGLSIERIDNDKGYSKANCKWATKSEQMKNRRKFNRGRRVHENIGTS